ncbi:MAG: Do family serine endopeptidase [Hyphomicrobiaceae bacterium]
MSLTCTGRARNSRDASAGRHRRFSSVVAVGVLAAAAASTITSANAQLSSDRTLARAPLTFADVVEKVKPAVVSIRVTNGGQKLSSRVPNRGRGFGGSPFPDLPEDHPLNEFFKNLPRGGKGDQVPRRQRPRAQGSGFVISENGYVVTNNHVIDGASQITVVFDEKNKYDAELVGADPRTDLALLKIKSGKRFDYVRFATKKSRVGDWVVAVGNPFGLGGTVTAGILSAQGRDIGSGPYDFIQVDAAVNRGNSGGPTFNLNGEVIGVNTAIYSPSGGNVGIAFAVPAATTLEVIEQLKNSGTVSRGWLGVRIQTVSDDMAASLGLDDAHGALINEVTKGGPAADSGLRAGDAITSVNNLKIESSRDLARKIAAFAPGTTVDVKVRRIDRDVKIRVKLGTFPSQTDVAAKPADKPKKAEPTALADLGLGLVKAKGTQKGVSIQKVDPDSHAAEKGLQEGDIILEVNSQKVAEPGDVDKAVKAAKKLGRKAVLMTVKRGENRRFVAVQLKVKS